MLATNEAHGVGVLKVVGKAVLGNVGCPSKPCYPCNTIVLQGGMEGVRRYEREIEPDAPEVEAKLVGNPGGDQVRIGECPRHCVPDKSVIEPRQIVEARRLNEFVVEPSKAHRLVLGSDVVNANLMVVV